MYYDQKFDVIIQAGQSNAEGTGIGSTTEPYVPSSDIFYMLDSRDYLSFSTGQVEIKSMDEENTIKIAEEREYQGERYGDLSLTFAKDYVKSGRLQEGRKLLIVRTASGGTGFESGHWKVGDYLYLRMMALTKFALSLNPENRVVAFLWHQGENDCGADPIVYAKRLSQMLQSVRKAYGENVPFIAADFVNEWKTQNVMERQPIVDAIRKVVEANSPAMFVETSDLLSNNQQTGNGDPIHFSKDSLYKLGHRYFDAFSKL